MNTDLKLNIDASSLTSTKLTKEDFTNDIEGHLQTILNHEFADNFEKQKIKNSTSGLNFACPFCHDSATDNRKKRAYFILNGRWAGRFKCFNCGMGMTIQKFFTDFDVHLSLSDLNYINRNLSPEPSTFSTLQNNITASVVSKSDALKYGIDREYIRKIFDLKNISKEATPLAWNYLVGRCQYRNYERFLYSEKNNQILILNLADDKVLGMQLRNIGNNSGVGPKYLTMTIDKMRSAILKDDSKIPETVSNLSCVFNIFNVDFAHTNRMPVLVTEGPFDAFLLPNCIALSGASKNFSMQFPFWYLFDNDETGSEHAMEKLKQGYNVFMWKKFKNEYNIPDINPYINNGNKRKWDVTDIMKYLRDYNINKKLLWSPYFTNSMLNGLNV